MPNCDSIAGRNANLTGKDFENTIEHRLQQKGYVLWDRKSDKPNKWYAKQYNIGKNLIGNKFIVDFILNGETIIECKWQGVAGSVDEKYLWTITNLAHTRKPSIMIVEGGGCRPNMYNYIKNHSKELGTVTVCNLSEFFQMNI